MFREMRRKKQLLSEKENIEILKNGTSGVLALLGDNEYPYAIPISYVYDNSKIYFHGAKNGHKIDAIKKCNKASFCVIAQDEIHPEKYTTYFKSVIIFGKIRILQSENEIRQAIEKLAIKYHPKDDEVNRNQEIEREWKPLCMIELSIEHMTGKEAIETAKKKWQFTITYFYYPPYKKTELWWDVLSYLDSLWTLFLKFGGIFLCPFFGQ